MFGLSVWLDRFSWFTATIFRMISFTISGWLIYQAKLHGDENPSSGIICDRKSQSTAITRRWDTVCSFWSGGARGHITWFNDDYSSIAFWASLQGWVSYFWVIWTLEGPKTLTLSSLVNLSWLSQFTWSLQCWSQNSRRSVRLWPLSVLV